MRNRAVSLSICVLLFNSIGGPCFADLLVATQFEDSVLRIDEQTGAELPNGVAPGSAGLDAPSGLTVGPDGNIYVSSLNTGQVLFFSGTTGLPLPSPHMGAPDGLFAQVGTFEMPNSTAGPLRFGPDGNLYVSDFGTNLVRKFNGTTGVEITPPPATVFVGPPAGLTFASNGDLYVGDFGSASVNRFSGGVPSLFIPSTSGGLQSPSSLLFLPNGNLLVVDLFGDQILEYSPSGEGFRQFAEIELDLGPMPPPNPDPSDNPSDIIYDGDGNLIVAVLGPTAPTFPPDPPTQTYGTLLEFDLEGGDPIRTILSNQTPFSSVAWIKAVDAIPGDYNSNGFVNTADYAKWQADFGKTVAKGGGADGSGNGLIDAADYVLWRKMIPVTPPDDSGGVPEPTTAALVLLVSLLTLGVQRRPNRNAL